VYGEGGTGVHGNSPNGAGVWGSSSDGFGVSGSSTNDIGVRGGSTNGTGVYGTAAFSGTVGIATAIGSETTGVYGKATSLLGRGVYGEGGYHGVYAVGTDTSGVAHGVYGRTNSGATASSGVYGHAAAGQGITYGVYGRSDSSMGYGLYSDGDARVEGNLTVSGDLEVLGDISSGTRAATLSVAPAAFVPRRHDIEYTNDGYQLALEGFSIVDLRPFFAPLQLPQDAVITRVTGCFLAGRSLSPEGCCLRIGIDRSDLTGAQEVLAFAGNPEVQGGNSLVCIEDNTVDQPVVDNDNHVYYLWMSMYRDAVFYGMKVEYEYSTP
jgi:hypothetical protein